MMFEDYVKEFILQPLGMTNTGFEYSQEYVLYVYNLTCVLSGYITAEFDNNTVAAEGEG